MSKIVSLRKAGNSRVFTAPVDLAASLGTKFEMELLADGSVIYRPVTRQNIFSTPEWQNYDFQKDLHEDSDLQPLQPVGKEWSGE
ncbi:hypothetical protein ACFP1L_13815 [Lactiplantibacillus nangangensis]|uniref:SpoVT-AbrB domain-containing protein n=1 Tax=Lactiplantibacillus nangangensis TaxID=2559917 RepID=A0ABW1SMN9_9LACO|nr:hypothetical protein [Lactiplantibacillus nangangensis]